MTSIIFSTKFDGDLLFKRTLNNAEANRKIRQNRLQFFEKHGIDPARVVNLNGSHGTHIEAVITEDLGKGALDPITRIRDTDGLVTDVPNSYLMITGADCFPLLFWSDNENIIGAAHAGWRGIIQGIAPEMVKAFRERFAAESNAIRAWIGPGIRVCHFEIKKDTLPCFEEKYGESIVRRDQKIFVDLPRIIKKQLRDAGVSDDHITEHPDCTFCNSKDCYSFRRDKPAYVEANAFLIHKK